MATMDTPTRTLFTKNLTLSQQVNTTGIAHRPQVCLWHGGLL